MRNVRRAFDLLRSDMTEYARNHTIKGIKISTGGFFFSFEKRGSKEVTLNKDDITLIEPEKQPESSIFSGMFKKEEETKNGKDDETKDVKNEVTKDGKEGETKGNKEEVTKGGNREETKVNKKETPKYVDKDMKNN